MREKHELSGRMTLAAAARFDHIRSVDERGSDGVDAYGVLRQPQP
jgi:hypothetical protein